MFSNLGAICHHKNKSLNEYPLKPHFYIKLGYTGVNLFFLFLIQNIDCGYTLEPPLRGGSNVPTINILRKNIKTSKLF